MRPLSDNMKRALAYGTNIDHENGEVYCIVEHMSTRDALIRRGATVRFWPWRNLRRIVLDWKLTLIAVQEWEKRGPYNRALDYELCRDDMVQPHRQWEWHRRGNIHPQECWQRVREGTLVAEPIAYQYVTHWVFKLPPVSVPVSQFKYDEDRLARLCSLDGDDRGAREAHSRLIQRRGEG